jgi:hypothetical protein
VNACLRSLSVVLLCLPLAGCLALAAGAAAGYGAVQVAENESSRTYACSMERAWNASLDALGDVGAPRMTVPPPTRTEGAFRAGDVWVRVEKVSETAVRVRVRIGTFDTADHRRRAALYLDAVSSRLSA